MAEENGALHLAQFQERGIRRVLQAVARKPTQNLLCLGGAQTERGGKFDHLVILLPNELPLDGAREDWLQIGIGIRLPRFGTIELLRVEIFQTRQQLKAQQRAESKSQLALTMSIHVGALHLHL